jgi:hypothetical protein
MPEELEIKDITYQICKKVGDEEGCKRPYLNYREMVGKDLKWMQQRFYPESIVQVKTKKDKVKERKKEPIISKWESCRCWINPSHGDGDKSKFPVANMLHRSMVWYTTVVGEQIDNIPSDISEVNIFLKHRHDFHTDSGKQMHISVFPPEGPERNMWHHHLTLVALVLRHLDQRFGNIKKNFYISSAEGAIISLIYCIEMALIASERFGIKVSFDFENIHLYHFEDSKYVEISSPLSLKREKQEEFSLLFGGPEKIILQCKGLKKNNARCTRRQVNSYCWQHP